MTILLTGESYIESENMIRVTLWGDIRFMSSIAEMIRAILE